MTRHPVTLVLVSLLGWAVTAHAAETPAGPATPVRVGDHPGFGRIVFDLPAQAGANVVAEGQRVLLVFQGAGSVSRPADLPRNLLAIRTGEDTATLELAPGAKARPVRLGDRLVIDLLDPPGARAAQRPPAAAVGASRTGSAARPAPPAAQAEVARPALPPVSAMPAAPVVATPPPAASPPAAVPPVEAPTRASPATVEPVRAVPLAPPGSAPPATVPAEPAVADPVLLVRADSDVGAAAFRRGEFGVVVLDRRLSPQPVPSGVTWTQAPAATVLMMPLPRDRGLRLKRTGSGWSVEPVPVAALGRTELGGQSFPLARPGRRVAVLDPLTGGALLVGASLDGGDGVGEGRRTPAFRVLSSWLGLAVEPYSDQVDVLPGPGGFALVGDAVRPVTPGNALTRRFDLPDLPAPELANRLRAQLASAASAAPRARSHDRLAAVQTMVALGMGAEAQALANQVAQDDPQAGADAQTAALAAVAALLAGRPGEAGSLNDPRLDGTDEITLWRGLRDRRLGTDSEAAAALGRVSALAAGYPPSLRRLVWPELAEAAVEAGTVTDAASLPLFAAAMRLEHTGKLDDAIKAFDALAAGPDRSDQVRAAARAAELRLATNRITPGEAAAVMERQGFAWRGDAREAGFRLRAAALRAAAREWRPALDALRTIEAEFPEQKDRVQTRKAAVMQALLESEGANLSALDLVLLAADYADCVPEGPAGLSMARVLAEKLAALDLPVRSIPVLQGLMRSTQPGEARAEFGVRLAGMLLDGGDAGAALASLDASAVPGLPSGLAERRALMEARLRAASGDVPGAASLLVRLDTDGAHDLRAQLLAGANDWRGSLAALSTLAAKVVPSSGRLDEAAQEILMRQANAAAQAGDAAILRALARDAKRMDGTRAEVFRLLTAAPLDGTADLPRGLRELTAARELPQRLQAAGLR